MPLRAEFFRATDSPQIERLDNGQGFLIGMADSAEKEKSTKKRSCVSADRKRAKHVLRL